MSYEIEEISCSCPPDEEGGEQFNLFARKNILDSFIIKQLSIVCFTTSVVLTVTICAVTFCRYILKSDLFGYEEWVKLIAFWLYFMGAAAGAYNRTHVSADLVNAYLENGVLKSSLIILRNLITVAVCLLFTGYCYTFFVFGYVGPVSLAQGKGMEAVEWLRLAGFGLYFAAGIAFANYAARFVFRLVSEKKQQTPMTDILKINRELPYKTDTFWLRRVCTYAAAFVFFVLAIAAVGLFFKYVILVYIGAPQTGLAIRTTALWRIGMWIGYLSVFLGFIIMTFYFLRDLFLSCQAADAQEFDIIRIKEVSTREEGA